MTLWAFRHLSYLCFLSESGCLKLAGCLALRLSGSETFTIRTFVEQEQECSPDYITKRFEHGFLIQSARTKNALHAFK